MAKIILTTVALAALLASSAFAQDVDQEYADKVTYLDDDGETQAADKVKVTSATYREVAYEGRGGRSKSTREGKKVLRITYGDTPRVYLEGEKELKEGHYETAASSYKGAKNAVELGRARPWLLEYASLRIGQAMTALARQKPEKAADAIVAYEEALKANPESLLFDEIQLGLAEAYSIAERWDEAKAAAQKLVDVGKEIKHAVWQGEGLQAVAKILLAQGDFKGAENIYRDLVLHARREIQYADGAFRKKQLADMEKIGAVEQGWALVAWAEKTKNATDWDKARTYFEGLPGQYPKDEVVAAAVLNGVGRSLMDKDPRAALLKFVEAEVKHFTARTEVARALWLKAQALKMMPDKVDQDAAEAALAELREFYPDSEWAKK